MKSKQRNNLKLKENIHVLHFLESGYSVPQASKIFDVHPQFIMRLLVQKNEIYYVEAQGAPVDMARVLKRQYQDVKRDVLEFIGFVRNE